MSLGRSYHYSIWLVGSRMFIVYIRSNFMLEFKERYFCTFPICTSFKEENGSFFPSSFLLSLPVEIALLREPFSVERFVRCLRSKIQLPLKSCHVYALVSCTCIAIPPISLSILSASIAEAAFSSILLFTPYVHGKQSKIFS